MEKDDALEDLRYGVLFAIRRSIRYHDRRRAYFELMHRVSSVFVVLLASSVFLDLLEDANRPIWLTPIAMIAALLSTLDLIIGFSRCATLHHDFKRRFTHLEIEAIKAESEKTLRDIMIERLRIEQDEPPVYRALDLLCHNEVAKATGVTEPKEFAKVEWYQSLTRHVWHWANMPFETKME